MSDLNRLLALKAFAESTWDCFAGFGDWKQQQTADGPRMVSPSGKRKLTLDAFQRLSGRKKKEKPAGPRPTKPAGAKGGPKPGEPERILTAKAKIAREAHEAAVRDKLPEAEIAALKRRADAAEAELKAGPKLSPTLPVSSLPALPKPEVPAPAPKPKAAPPAKARPPIAAPEYDPKKKVADPNAVVRQPPRSGPPPKGSGSSRAGTAAAKARAQVPNPTPAVPPRADGAPDLPALKKSVDDGIVTNRALGWNYETTAARAALQAAEQQITDWARRYPRKALPLVREVTGEGAGSTEEGIKKLKAWVGETLDLLDPGRRSKGGVERHSERRVFVELRGRLAGVRALCAALCA